MQKNSLWWELLSDIFLIFPPGFTIVKLDGLEPCGHHMFLVSLFFCVYRKKALRPSTRCTDCIISSLSDASEIVKN